VKLSSLTIESQAICVGIVEMQRQDKSLERLVWAFGGMVIFFDGQHLGAMWSGEGTG